MDYIDMSMWDCFKEPAEEEFKGRDHATTNTTATAATPPLATTATATATATTTATTATTERRRNLKVAKENYEWTVL
jgi:hypothetical protein